MVKLKREGWGRGYGGRGEGGGSRQYEGREGKGQERKIGREYWRTGLVSIFNSRSAPFNKLSGKLTI